MAVNANVVAHHATIAMGHDIDVVAHLADGSTVTGRVTRHHSDGMTVYITIGGRAVPLLDIERFTRHAAVAA